MLRKRWKIRWAKYWLTTSFSSCGSPKTEKYAHVTFFFNGGEEEPNIGEDRVLIPSPKVATYDLQPEMSAELVTDKLAELLDTDKYDMIILNFAIPIW